MRLHFTSKATLLATAILLISSVAPLATSADRSIQVADTHSNKPIVAHDVYHLVKRA
ncbi:hypothetical protein BGZ94_004267, partial [Podila epigama]